MVSACIYFTHCVYCALVSFIHEKLEPVFNTSYMSEINCKWNHSRDLSRIYDGPR